MKNNKKAKFFCENCGAEVAENAKFCGGCGKFFISVRCPKCGATGSHSQFANGCPECGYAVKDNSKAFGFSSNKMNRKKGLFAFNKSGKVLFNHNYSSAYSTKTSDSSLPVWIYILTTIVLVFTLIAVYSCIRSY